MSFAHVLAGVATLALAGCNDASVVSQNLSQDADNFRVMRRVVFYNGITNDYILTIEGFCSQQPEPIAKKIAVVCKVGEGQYKKHFLGLSDNVTYFSEQLESKGSSASRYRVTFKPSTIIPEFELR